MVDEDAKVLGIAPPAMPVPEHTDFEVWQDNWPTLELFCRAGTQWRVTAMGNAAGLDYVGLEAVARLSGFQLTPEVFADIQAMERAALPVLNGRN